MSLTRITGYRRTVLVIWPPWISLGNGGGNRRLAHALNLLDSAHSSQPNAEEEKLFYSIADWSKGPPNTAAFTTLSSIARRWLRPDLWDYVCLSIRNGKKPATTMPMKETLAAVLAFGFEAARSG
jgi:hypothetical protein